MNTSGEFYTKIRHVYLFIYRLEVNIVFCCASTLTCYASYILLPKWINDGCLTQYLFEKKYIQRWIASKTLFSGRLKSCNLIYLLIKTVIFTTLQT